MTHPLSATTPSYSNTPFSATTPSYSNTPSYATTPSYIHPPSLSNKFLQWITKALPYSAVGVALFMCFNYSLQFFSPLLFSAITLVDPACTGLVSWAVGIEGIPDIYTWVRGLNTCARLKLLLIEPSPDSTLTLSLPFVF